MHRIHVVVTAMRVALMALAVGSASVLLGAAIQLEPPATPALLDPVSDPYATIYQAFRRSGWPARQAAVLAAKSVLPGFEIPDSDHAALTDVQLHATTALLEPTTDPYAIMYGEFRRSGWSSHEAAVHAAATLNMEGETECWISAVTIIYCSGGQKKKTSTWLNGDCWTAQAPNGDSLQSCIGAIPVCQTGEVIWLKLTKSSAGECNPGSGDGCVFMHVEPPTWKPCPGQREILACSCFEELTPPDCADIEHICCNPDGSNGPCASAGCPFDCD